MNMLTDVVVPRPFVQSCIFCSSCQNNRRQILASPRQRKNRFPKPDRSKLV
jgi:hypothetical protein